MQITFLGHACFELSDGVHTLLVDPYLTGNGLAAKTAAEVNPDFIFVTHAHGDHIGDTASIAKRTGAAVYAVVELADGLLAGQGIKAARGNIGGRQATPFGSVKYRRKKDLPCGRHWADRGFLAASGRETRRGAAADR